MKNIHARSLIITACAVTVLLMSASSIRADEVIGLLMENWQSAEIKGTIMCVETNPESIVVNEVQILIADTTKDGKRCATRVMDTNGREVDINALGRGKAVYVKVGAAIDPEKETEYVVAKEIYILPREMSRKELINRGIPIGPTTPW